LEGSQVQSSKVSSQCTHILFALCSPELGQIGYVRLTSFGEHTGRDAEQVMRLLESQGASAFIIDLRGNTGGLVSSGTPRLPAAPTWDAFGPSHWNLHDGSCYRASSFSWERTLPVQKSFETGGCPMGAGRGEGSYQTIVDYIISINDCKSDGDDDDDDDHHHH
jgi:hypothetical protein